MSVSPSKMRPSAAILALERVGPYHSHDFDYYRTRADSCATVRECDNVRCRVEARLINPNCFHLFGFGLAWCHRCQTYLLRIRAEGWVYAVQQGRRPVTLALPPAWRNTPVATDIDAIRFAWSFIMSVWHHGIVSHNVPHGARKHILPGQMEVYVSDNRITMVAFCTYGYRVFSTNKAFIQLVGSYSDLMPAQYREFIFDILLGTVRPMPRSGRSHLYAHSQSVSTAGGMIRAVLECTDSVCECKSNLHSHCDGHFMLSSGCTECERVFKARRMKAITACKNSHLAHVVLILTDPETMFKYCSEVWEGSVIEPTYNVAGIPVREIVSGDRVRIWAHIDSVWYYSEYPIGVFERIKRTLGGLITMVDGELLYDVSASVADVVTSSVTVLNDTVTDHTSPGYSAACVICLEAPPTMVVVPCGHMCLCEKCADKVAKTCPICRRSNITIIKVHVC
jgi:hypothetical protein